MPAKRARDLSTTCGLLIEAASYLQRGMHDDVERATGLVGGPASPAPHARWCDAYQ
jgi:hypothetical protein